MSRTLQRAQPSKRPAYTVSDDWTSAGGGLKKLRLWALEKPMTGSSEVPMEFQETITRQANMPLRPGMVGPAIPVPPHEIAKKLDLQPGQQPTQQQVVVLQQQMRMQQMAQLQQNAMQGENSNMEQRSASSPMPNSNHALQDAQMQLMLLEQQNKIRLSMPPIEKDSVNPSLAADSGLPPPQPPEMGITRDHDGQMKQPPSLYPAFTRMNQQQMPPLHQMTSLSSDNRHRRRLRSRQIGSQLTTHTHQSGSPNTAQSLQQSSAMSMLGRPMILSGQPFQTPPPTYSQPTSQLGQQMDQTMARSRQWQPMTNEPGGSSAPKPD
ncbi:hypothetical protein KCU78_g479, partial [Aureobasidium melanogenum]